MFKCKIFLRLSLSVSRDTLRVKVLRKYLLKSFHTGEGCSYFNLLHFIQLITRGDLIKSSPLETNASYIQIIMFMS